MKTKALKTRELRDLAGIGKAMLRDFELLGVGSVEQLAKTDPQKLYDRLCRVTGTPQDPCVLDTFRCAVAQARDPKLPKAQRDWWWWSRQRKAGRQRKNTMRAVSALPIVIACLLSFRGEAAHAFDSRTDSVCSGIIRELARDPSTLTALAPLLDRADEQGSPFQDAAERLRWIVDEMRTLAPALDAFARLRPHPRFIRRFPIPGLELFHLHDGVQIGCLVFHFPNASSIDSPQRELQILDQERPSHLIVFGCEGQATPTAIAERARAIGTQWIRLDCDQRIDADASATRFLEALFHAFVAHDRRLPFTPMLQTRRDPAMRWMLERVAARLRLP